MADGDAWSLDRTTCRYDSDSGGFFTFRALSAYQTQASLGWSTTLTNADGPIPKGLKPRKALCWDAGDHSKRRAVVVATPAAYAALVVDTTTLIVQNPDTDVEDTFTVYAKEGERRRPAR